MCQLVLALHSTSHRLITVKNSGINCTHHAITALHRVNIALLRSWMSRGIVSNIPRYTRTCACAMPVPPSFSHSVMDVNPGNLGESSLWAESQALEVRETLSFTFKYHSAWDFKTPCGKSCENLWPETRQIIHSSVKTANKEIYLGTWQTMTPSFNTPTANGSDILPVSLCHGNSSKTALQISL